MELWKLKHLVEINCHFSIEYLVKVREKKMNRGQNTMDVYCRSVKGCKL